MAFLLLVFILFSFSTVSLVRPTIVLPQAHATTYCKSLLSSDKTPVWVREHNSPKPLTPELIAAIEKIPEVPGRRTRIMVPIAAGASPEGVDAIISRARHMKSGVEIHMWVNGIPSPIIEKIRNSEGKVAIIAHFLGPNMRALYQDGYIQLVPGYLRHFAARVVEKDPKYQFDIILTRVSTPNGRGEVSLGANSDMVHTILKEQPNTLVIAEVNSNVPFTFALNGTNSIPNDRIVARFSSSSKLAYPAVTEKTAAEMQIGLNLASLIPDGSTLQVGIGSIFGGLPAGLALHQRKNLRIWTEMMGDPLMEVVNQGVATEAVAGFGFGSQKFYDWLHLNSRVRLAPTVYVNSLRNIMAIEGFHAMNTALQVALTGEVNATAGPPERGRISSPGGQVEFLAGASESKGGKSIIALRSTASIGDSQNPRVVSTIVPRTYPVRDGTPSAFVSHVVTEYGIAHLMGQTEREIAIGLIRIAHPDFRRELFMEAIDPASPNRVPGLVASDRAQALGASK